MAAHQRHVPRRSAGIPMPRLQTYPLQVILSPRSLLVLLPLRRRSLCITATLDKEPFTATSRPLAPLSQQLARRDQNTTKTKIDVQTQIRPPHRSPAKARSQDLLPQAKAHHQEAQLPRPTPDHSL